MSETEDRGAEAREPLPEAALVDDVTLPELPRDELERRVREAYALVDGAARRVSRQFGGKVPFGDLKAYGSDALLAIASRWDPSKSKLSTYASMKLAYAMKDGIRRDHRGRLGARAAALLASQRYGEATTTSEPPRELPTDEQHHARLRTLLDGHAAALAVGLLAVELAGGAPDVEGADARFERAELGAEVKRAVRDLPDPRQRALVERHYFGGEQFDAIAKDLGISKSWASRVHAQAIDHLAKRLRGSIE